MEHWAEGHCQGDRRVLSSCRRWSLWLRLFGHSVTIECVVMCIVEGASCVCVL